MSAYLQFFQLEQSPFEGKSRSQVVLGTRAVRDAFAAIRKGLEEGASRLCVSGGAGLGKTSLARALPKLLGESARTALVPDPSVSWQSARHHIARQWGLEGGTLARPALVAATSERPLLLVLDQAERVDEDFLDHLDVLLSYRTEEDRPVVQCVLLARLEADAETGPPPLVWWLDRLQTLQLEFAPLPRDGVAAYLAKHLRRAGWQGESLFQESAAHAIHGYTGGVPGEISALAERLLIEAAGLERREIDATFVHDFCDPEPVDETAASGVLAEAEVTAQQEIELDAVADQFDAFAMEGRFDDVAAGEASTWEPEDGSSEAAPEATRSATAEAAEADSAWMGSEDAPAETSPDALQHALAFFEGAGEATADEAANDDTVHPEHAAHDDTLHPVDAAAVPDDAEAGWDPFGDEAADEDFDPETFSAPSTPGLLGRGRPIGIVALAAMLVGLAYFALSGAEPHEDPDVTTPGVAATPPPPPEPARLETRSPAPAFRNPSGPGPGPLLASPAGQFLDPKALDGFAAQVLDEARRKAAMKGAMAPVPAAPAPSVSHE